MQYKQLINALEHGFHVLVKTEYEYEVISPIKDEEGNWRRSIWCPFAETAKNYIGHSNGYYQKELKENCPDWELVEVFALPFKRWKAGDIVRIADNAEELCEKNGISWNLKKQEMVGKKCEVQDFQSSDYRVWDEDKNNHWILPHEALLPVFDEEVEEEVTIKISRKSLKALEESGIKIIK